MPVDSPQEMAMLVDILRNESPVFGDAEHDLLMTGYECVGEGEGEGAKQGAEPAQATG